MSNTEVAAALAADKSWRVAYPFVEGVARSILDGGTFSGSTTELVERIYSSAEAHDPKVRTRVFRALKACSTRALKRYCTAGELEPIGSNLGMGRRLTWHAPSMVVTKPAEFCPTCKRPL